MENNDIERIGRLKSPVFSALLFLLITLVGFLVVGPALGMLVGSFFYQGDISQLEASLQNPLGNPSMKTVLMVVQGFATGIGMILLPAMYIRSVDRKPLSILNSTAKVTAGQIILSVAVIWTFMIVNTVFIDFNQGLQLPEAMGEAEQWIRDKEDWARELTTYLTQFDSTAQFLLAFLVIAVLPAIGEELVFRGYIQNEVRAATGNPHLAIWIAAFLFSAIHMQFLGLLPRMLLGAMFGYLYFWSGNFLYPVIGHFIQNGSQLLLLYMVQKGVIEMDLESTEALPWYQVLIFAVLTFALLYKFRNLSQKTDL